MASPSLCLCTRHNLLSQVLQHLALIYGNDFGTDAYLRNVSFERDSCSIYCLSRILQILPCHVPFYERSCYLPIGLMRNVLVDLFANMNASIEAIECRITSFDSWPGYPLGIIAD